MLSVLRTLLLPFVPGRTVKVDLTAHTPRTRWSSEWSSITGSQYFGGTLMSVKDAGATLTYNFTGTSIRVYGTLGETSSSNQVDVSYVLDGSTPCVYQGSMTTGMSNILLYVSPSLEDAQHTLIIQNLVGGSELRLDYFEVSGQGGKLIPLSPLSRRSIHPRNLQPLQPAVIAGLVLAAVAVLLGFVMLFFLWRREYSRKRKEALDSSEVPSQLQDDPQTVPFLDERTRIDPFIATPMPSQPSRASTTTTTGVVAIPLVHPRSPREQVPLTSSSHRDGKRPLPAAQVYTMESISRLNLGLDVNLRDHSVVGQPSNYGSEASADPPEQNRENDGGVSLLGSSRTVNPKVLRLPPDYRRFYR